MLVACFVYFLASFWLSMLRSSELFTSNWDNGIFQQALWSSSNGHLFYEAGDYEMSGASSFLEIHPSLLLLAIVPVYALLPSPLTLLAIQSAVIAAAAIPLFLLARHVTGSSRLALLAALLYLVFPPLVAANLADFHLEAFLPIETFALTLLLLRNKHIAATGVAALSFVTIEIGPVLVASVAFFVLWPSIRHAFSLAPHSSPKAGPDHSAREPWGKAAFAIRELWGASSTRFLIGLLAFAGVGYLAIRFLQNDPSLIGLGPGAVAGNPPVSFTPGDIHVAPSHITVSLFQKISYWMLCYALVLFLPLRAPRTFIIAVPWIGYTFLSSNTLTILGLENGAITVVPLFIGLTFGMRGIRLSSPFSRARRANGDDASSAPALAPRKSKTPLRLMAWWLPVPTSRAWSVLMLVTFLACLVLIPFDPLVQTHVVGQSGYNVTYSPAPGDSRARMLADRVVAGSTVLASDCLFPLVANDVHAYALLWVPNTFPPFLPFNSSHLPQYVFLASDEAYSVPPWLETQLTTPGVYMLVGEVNDTDRGTVSLFDHAAR